MKKILALGILVMALTGIVTAADAQTQAGASVDTVLLVSTANYPDAHIASAASSKASIPVLLSEKDQLPQETKDTLQELAPSEIVVVGGEAVISADVVAELESMGYTVTRLWGVTRYGTAVKVSDYFWPGGADEATLVENDFDDERGNVLALGKEIAQRRENPIFLTPTGTIPAGVLSQLQELGVEEVTIIGTDLSDTAKQQLSDIGVSVREEISAESEQEVESELRDRVASGLNSSETLNVVASTDFRHSIAAVNNVRANAFVVSGEDEISGAVDAVINRNIQRVRVVGDPQLGATIASELRAETDAEVVHVNVRASQAASFSANISEDEHERWKEMREKARERAEQEKEDRKDFLRERANKTIQRAAKRLDNNSSDSAHSALVEARAEYDEGDFQAAIKLAIRAMEEERSYDWESERHNASELRKQAREEVQDLQDRVEDLKELNREFGEEMEDNMTVEERLEVIREFKDKRRQTVRELMEEARSIRDERREDIHERLREAERRHEAVSGHGEIELSCSDDETRERLEVSGHDGEVRTKGHVGLNSPNYRGKVVADVDREAKTVSFRVVLTKRDGMGVQCTGELEFEASREVAAGNWTVDTTVEVDGQAEAETSGTVTVTKDDDEDGEKIDGRTGEDNMERCRGQVQKAKEQAEGRSCTMQVKELACPHGEYTYSARNGCEIGYLEDKGWSAPSDDTHEESGDDDSARSSDVELACGTDSQVQEISVSGHDGYVRAEGTVGLNTPNYEHSVDTQVDRDTNTVTFTLTLTKRSGAGIQCVGELDFTLEESVPEGDWDVKTVVKADGGVEVEQSGMATVSASAETETSAETSSDSDRTVVEYDEDGFSPQRVTVDKGDTVVWESEGPDMWVASANHPEHTKYDGTDVNEHCDDGESDTFDSCQSRDRYSFMFEKTGEWGYHNHLAYQDTGIVTVE